MHLILNRKATKPARLHSLQQQAQFEDFIDIFNNQSPYQASIDHCII